MNKQYILKRYEVTHRLHKYLTFRHHDWDTTITNEIVTCTEKSCNFKSYKTTEFHDRCPVCYQDTLSTNVRLKADVDTSIIKEPKTPRALRSLRTKYGWIFQELPTTSIQSESRFNGIVQFHNYNS